MGALISYYISSFVYGESDFNNNNIPDRREVINFALQQLDKKKDKDKNKILREKAKKIKKLLKR